MNKQLRDSISEFTKEEIGELVESTVSLIPFSFDPTFGIKDKVTQAIFDKIRSFLKKKKKHVPDDYKG